MDSPLNPTTNFKDNNGTDLGDKLVTKDYLISVYPGLAPQLGITPELWTWGNSDSGQLGNANTTNRSTPVTTIIGGTNWKQISSGYRHTTAIKTDGTLWTWGNGLFGQLGTNDTVNRSTPVTTFTGILGWADTPTTNPEDLYTLSAGWDHTAAIKTDGTLWTWGNGSYGRLGNAGVTDRSTPVTTFTGVTNWKQVSSGSRHTAAIKTDGTLWTWGNGNFGALGNATTTTINSTPVTTFSGGTDWKQVSSGYWHIAAIKTDGTLWTWGYGQYGRFGNGIIAGIRSTPVTTFTGGTDWKQVSAGYDHTAAIKTDGTLWIWGSSRFGARGDASFSFNMSTPITTFAGGNNWKQVSCGYRYTSAIKTDGTLWMWGRGSSGQLGNADTSLSLASNLSTPVTTFAGGTNWKQVSCGTFYTAAIKTDGTLWTWGLGTLGRLGNAVTTGSISTPVTTFAGGTNWKQVSAGNQHTLALRDDGVNKELFAWGNGRFGQLGNANTINVSTPVTTFTARVDWKQVSSGRDYTAAIKTDGTLWTWGEGTYGKLGWARPNSAYGTLGSVRSTPVTTFVGGTNWTEIEDPSNLYTLSVGGDNISAIKTDGTLWVWGNGSFGLLGNAGVTNRSTPVTTFTGGANWEQVSTGIRHTTAIKTDGTLWLWGDGTSGCLGTATSPITMSTPVTTFAGGTNWKQVSVGRLHTAAIKTDGTLWTWGEGQFGRLGNATTTVDNSTPSTTFAGGTNWKQVSAGYQYTTAIKTDGTLWTWGNGRFGQLGNANTTNVSTPVTTFTGGTNWKQVSAGYIHISAIKTDGTLWTWGNGSYGRLGNAGVTDRSTPVTTFTGGVNWKQVSVGRKHTAAIKTDGTLWTWGYGFDGALGDASTSFTNSTPITTFAGGTNWKQVSCGGSGSSGNTIALRDDGINKELFTWGYASSGQLGNGVTTAINISTPVTTFAGGTNWADIEEDLYTLSAGKKHTVAIKTDGTLWTWGSSTSFLGVIATGINNSSQGRFTPVTTFAGGTTWKQITIANQFDNASVAAIKTDGTLWTWGNGFNGRLGNKKRQNRSTPVTTFAGGTNWKQVSGGYAHMVAIKTDGTLWTWGRNQERNLGTGDAVDRVTPVTTFAGGTNWKQVSTGYYTVAAIKTDGTLWTWGRNVDSGLLGINDEINRSTPVTTFAGGTNWKQVSVGGRHIAAVKTDGTLWIWGNALRGRLGNGVDENIDRLTPVTTFAGGTNWKQVSCAGYQYTAAVKTDGTLWTWGKGDYGVLGINDTSSNIKSTPVTTFAGGIDWSQVDCGWNGTTIALKSNGTLWTWGRGSFGILGNNGDNDARITPVTTFAGGTNWVDTATTNPEDLYTISCGYYHSGAIKTDGTLWTWGRTASGETGDATFNKNYYDPLQVHGFSTTWKQVSGGYTHTAAIKTDGTLWIWGNGSYGQLGNFNSISVYTPITTFAGGTNWKQVSVGENHTAAIKTDGTIWTWGAGFSGKLGNLTLSRITPITTFAGGTNWADTPTTNPEDLYTLSVFNHTAAIKTDGTLWTWGDGEYGKLGNAEFLFDSFTPVTTFAGGTNWKQVSVSYFHTAAIKTDGTLWTWGKGIYGSLGNGYLTNRTTPITTFTGGINWKQVSSSERHTAAIKTDGTLWTWGYGRQGALGTLSNLRRITPVTTFAGGTNWADTATTNPEDLYTISCGYIHMSAIKTDGTLWTWGYQNGGVLGNRVSASVSASTPVTTFAGGTNWKQVSSGYGHSAAIKTDGTLWTWGITSNGKLGNGATASASVSTPVTTFAGGTNWKQVSIGDGQTTAIKTDGTLWIWGNGVFGQLGTNDISDRSTPVTTFAGGTNWKQVSTGGGHTAAIKTDGTLWTWGRGSYGRLGNGVITGSISTPVTTFAGGIDWKQVSVSFGRDLTSTVTSAIKTDGTLWTWGDGRFGRLGNAVSTGTISTPVTTFAGGIDWKQVSSSAETTTAIKTDGTLWTWGNNAYGLLGTNDVALRSTPVTTFAGGTSWKQVYSGRGVVALGLNNQLYVFGRDYLGNLGISRGRSTSFSHETFEYPIQVYGWTSDWKQVSASEFITSAIKTDGTLWLWGDQTNGRLGNGGTTGLIEIFTPITTFTGGINWKQVSTGDVHTAAIKTDGTLWTWGNGTSGKLGNANLTNRSTPVTIFTGGTNWKQVSGGVSHTTAVKTDGTLWSWGSGSYGQLGTNDVVVRSTPVTTFAGGSSWKQVSAGARSSVALNDDGVNKRLYVFGSVITSSSSNALLGIGDQFGNSTSIRYPIQVYGWTSDWKQVSAAAFNTSAVKTDGTLWTWGDGNFGRLGNSALTDRSTPVTTFIGGTNWKQVSHGIVHTAAVKTDGTLWGWGQNGIGQLGNARTTTTASTPVTTFTGGTNWKQVSTGGGHTAAIKTDGTLWTWGEGSVGQLGNARTTTTASTPVTTFAGGTNWKQVSGGGSHTIALNDDGVNKRLFVWGNNSITQTALGIGNFIVENASIPSTTFSGGSNWEQVSAGGNHTLSVKTDGTLWTWGKGIYGQLGNASTANRSTPITTRFGGTNWKLVSAGSEFSTSIKTDGTLWTWGEGSVGQLGNASIANRSTPVTTEIGGTNWKSVSAGSEFVTAIKNDGTLWTWGSDSNGQLGRELNSLDYRSTPITTFAGGTNWADTPTTNPEDLYTLSTSAYHMGAIKTDGTLYLWGSERYGKLGSASTIYNIITPITTFAGGTNWKQISCTDQHTAALKTDGTLWTWGYGGYGALGNAIETTNRSTPVTTFAGGTNWRQVSAGYYTTAAIKTDGTLWTWGYAGNAQLGNGYKIFLDISTPITTFAGGTNWKQVSCSRTHVSAIKTDGTLWLWGWAYKGALGNITQVNSYTPITTFAGGTNWADTPTTNSEDLYTLSVGSYHSTAIKTDGTLWIWGYGGDENLGNGNFVDTSTPITTFAGGINWKQVSSARYHTSAIKTDGTLWTWGRNIDGILGTNDIINRSTPVTTFAGGTNWKQVSASVSHTAAIKTDGTLWTWGGGFLGKLGNGVTTGTISTPITTFAGGTNWKQVSSGTAHTAAIKTDGTLWTWGKNSYGRLGNAVTAGNTSTPVTTFAGGTDWKQVSGGTSYIVAIKTDGTLWAWGNGRTGQLGNNDTTNKSTPVTTFTGGTNWKQVSGGDGETAGEENVAAIKTDGTLWTWGYGEYGRLGTNDQINRSTPVTTFAGGTNWKQVSVGRHIMALNDDGVNKRLFVWGDNSSGQLGNGSIQTIFGTTTYISTPITTFAGGTNWKQVSSGHGSTGAIKTDGTLWTWGYNYEGQCGIPDTFTGSTTTNVVISTPVTTFAGGTNWKQVSFSGGWIGNGSCVAAIKTDGTLWTWGYGFGGALGNANTVIKNSTPVTTFTGGTDWRQVTAGGNCISALKSDGTLWVWGVNADGQLGSLFKNNASWGPRPIGNTITTTSWKQASGGVSHTTAIKTDGTLWAWGSNNKGQLGNSDTTDRSTPVTTFAGGFDWKRVSASGFYTTAIKSSDY